MTYWSARVTRESRALILERGIFTLNDPVRIAKSLKKSALNAHRPNPFASAMSMLNFYINRAGTNLTTRRRRILIRTKRELRRLFGRRIL